MQDFPQKTFFNRVIPKAKFYEKLPVTQAVKDCFVNEIAAIVWRNKLSQETLNVQPGSRAREIEVIEITLKGETLNDSVLKLIDKGIPYQLLFMLKRGEEYQLCIGYKETENASVKEYFKTPWQTFSELPLQINGLTLDEVCDNFIRQGHGNLQAADSGDLKAELEVTKEEEKLQILKERKKGYEDAVRELLRNQLQVDRIKENQEAIVRMEEFIRAQIIKVEEAARQVEIKAAKLTELMQERKAQEKLKEKAFEAFLQEENAKESKEIDELVSFTYGRKQREE